MPMLHIILDGDGAFEHLRERKQHHVQTFTVTALEGGMESGQPSVAVVIELEDDSYVFAETSLKLFLSAADALKAKYGDPRKDAKETV